MPSGDFNKGMEAFIKKDYMAALKEFRPLVKQGHASAQFSLGWMYNNGEGVPQNHKTAIKWHTLSAEQGSAPAQFSLGQMYRKG